VEVESTPAGGTRFIVSLPLTLTTARALLVECAGDTYALPTASVERVLRAESLGRLGGRTMFECDGGAVPVMSLASILGGSASAAPISEVAGDGRPPTLALVGAGAHRLGLMIDRVIGEQEIVVKPLPFPVLRVRNFAGATILGSGRIVPILHVADLMRSAMRITPARVGSSPVEPPRRRMRVLIADDSLTTRTLERYILEAAGYEVEVATNGTEALALLFEREYDVLVSDVEMPGLDGVELTSRVRAEPPLRDLPVILVTSLDSPVDRERGLQAGADAYIVKSSFDQDQLLRTIREFAA
jgi:two-component system chemotaxis sensor kinase CheA